MLPVEVAQRSGQESWLAVAAVRTLAVPVVVAERSTQRARLVALELAQVRVRLQDLER